MLQPPSPRVLIPLLAFLVWCAALLPAQVVLSSKDLEWMTSHREGLELSKKSSKPMLLYFTNRRAIGCRDFEQITLRDEKVVAELKDYVLVAVDSSQDANLRRALKIIKVPTAIFMNSQGAELFRAVGYKPPAEFFNYLNAVPKAGATSSQGGGGGVPGSRGAGASTAQPTPAYNPSLMALDKRAGTEAVRFTFYSPQSLGVILAGDFNDWSESLMPLKKDPSGWFWLDLHIPVGYYEYKYIVDGEWKEDPRAAMRKDVPGYDTFNSVLKVGTPPSRPVVRGHSVTFLFYSRDASRVSVSGNFTNWGEVQMYAKGDGNWGIQYDLPPGTYQYKFVVDGEWIIDPGNYQSERDSGNNVNSIFHIQ